MAGDEMGGKETQCAGIDALAGIDRWMEYALGAYLNMIVWCQGVLGRSGREGSIWGRSLPSAVARLFPKREYQRGSSSAIECHGGDAQTMGDPRETHAMR